MQALVYLLVRKLQASKPDNPTTEAEIREEMERQGWALLGRTHPRITLARTLAELTRDDYLAREGAGYRVGKIVPSWAASLT